MNLAHLKCLMKIDLFQKLIEKECDKKLSTILLANIMDKNSLFFLLPEEVTTKIASHYFWKSANKQILTAPPPPSENQEFSL